MNILHVVPTYLPATRYGGPIQSVHGLCRALARLGHRVTVFTTDVDGPGHSNVPLGCPVDMDGVLVTYFPTGAGRRLYRSPAMGRALAQAVSRYDVVHLHSVFLWPTSVAAMHARRAGVPYVLAPRGMLVRDLIRQRSRLSKEAWIAAFERRNIARAAAVHATTRHEIDEMAKLGFTPNRIALIPNGIDLPHHRPKIPRNSDRADTILSLGRVHPVKGLDRLIRALSDVPGPRLVIAGNDEDGYTERLREIARETGVAHRVVFFGPALGEAKSELLASADVFALSSISENFGIAALEAMAAGLPVVVTPGVGLASAVQSNRAGIVADGSPAGLAGALRILVASADLRREMGQNGYRAARDQFSWDAIAGSCAELYCELKRGAPAASASLALPGRA